jgi:GxxExxY protein
VLVEHAFRVVYKSARIEIGYRLDLLVDNAVIVELKAVQRAAPIHKARLLSYLKLSNKNLGLLINLNTLHLKDGIIRMANNLPCVPPRPPAVIK